MNEKIKQLAEQANIVFDGNVCHCYKPELQLFADLLLEECFNKLRELNERANGQHNYYMYALMEIKDVLSGNKHTVS